MPLGNSLDEFLNWLENRLNEIIAEAEIEVEMETGLSGDQADEFARLLGGGE